MPDVAWSLNKPHLERHLQDHIFIEPLPDKAYGTRATTITVQVRGTVFFCYRPTAGSNEPSPPPHRVVTARNAAGGVDPAEAVAAAPPAALVAVVPAPAADAGAGAGAAAPAAVGGAGAGAAAAARPARPPPMEVVVAPPPAGRAWGDMVLVLGGGEGGEGGEEWNVSWDRPAPGAGPAAAAAE